MFDSQDRRVIHDRARARATSHRPLPHSAAVRRLFAVAILALGACGDDGDDGGGGPAGSAGSQGAAPYAYSACDPGERVGGFEAVADEDHRYSTVTGRVGNAIKYNLLTDVISSSGSCELVQPRTGFCDPACTNGQVCDGATCVEQSEPQDVGTVYVFGLDEDLTITPKSSVFNYKHGGELAHPAFEEDAPVTLSATPADAPAFTLQARGVAPLAMAEDSEIVLRQHMPVELQWAAPATPGQAHVLVSLNIALHGGTPVQIDCDTEDTGSLTIPAELVTELLGYGYSGFPAINIIRQTADSVELDIGCVDFIVGSKRSRVPVTIPGLTSCVTGGDSSDCPDGQSCQENMTCQ